MPFEWGSDWKKKTGNMVLEIIRTGLLTNGGTKPSKRGMYE